MLYSAFSDMHTRAHTPLNSLFATRSPNALCFSVIAVIHISLFWGGVEYLSNEGHEKTHLFHDHWAPRQETWPGLLGTNEILVS